MENNTGAEVNANDAIANLSTVDNDKTTKTISTVSNEQSDNVDNSSSNIFLTKNICVWRSLLDDKDCLSVFSFFMFG